MKPPVPPLVFAVLMFAGMLLCLETGYRVARRRVKESEGDRNILTPIEGAMFALLGLMLAFTFSGAASRFAEKRALIGEETNAIETAYLRLQVLPADTQPRLRTLFRNYLDSRLATYRKLPDMDAATTEMNRSRELQEEIWRAAIEAIARPEARPVAGFLLPPALNRMIDISTTRSVALQNHPPAVVYLLLFCLALIVSLMVGYRMSGAPRRSWLHILGFTTMMVAVVYVMLDVEYPRVGFFRLQDADRLFVQLHERMK